MFSKIFLISISLFLTYSAFGQTKDVQIWKNSHPNILLIEESDASDEFIDVLKSKNQAYIVYNHHFTMNDISIYNQKHNVFISDLSYAERSEIKLWKALNTNVNIISQNDFDQISVEKQQMYMNNSTLIYTDKELVLTEIYEYDAK